MTRRTAALIVSMVGIAVIAGALPCLFRDRGTELPAIVLQQLRAEASHGYTIPPGVMQITEVRAYGDYPYRAEGTVVYRSLFGVPVASARSYNNATAYDFARSRLAGLVGVFVLLEGILGFVLVRQWRV